MGQRQDDSQSLLPVIKIEPDKCVNCHACIAVCPVKFCNDASGDYVKLDADMCIGCGACLAACTHQARLAVDDFEAFLDDAAAGVKMVAVVSPSAAPSFPNQMLNLNGWLKSLGVEAVFDVAFGAELAAKSHVESIRADSPQNAISPACPAVVNFIEIYHPELAPFLSPVDSAMGHCMKMIRHSYPEYEGHKIVVVSPCAAKKREMAAIGLGDYAIGFASIAKSLEDTGKTLADFPEVDFENPPPLRGVLVSSPGGLCRNLAPHFAECSEVTRQISGTAAVCEYLDSLSGAIEGHRAPRLVDGLNCGMGCNGGPLTLARRHPVDDVEYWVEKRYAEMQALYRVHGGPEEVRKQLEQCVERHWDYGLYRREYIDRASNNGVRIPSDEEREAIFHQMYKYSEEDVYNCTACGYMTCQDMATAIFNGRNKPQNCHFYAAKAAELAFEGAMQREIRFRNILETTLEGFIHLDNDGHIEMINDAMCGILDRSTDEVIGRSFREFISPACMDTLEEQIRLREQDVQSVYEVDLVRKDGSLVSAMLSSSPLYDSEAEKTGTFALVSDITRVKETEEALRRSRDELELRVEERTQELAESNASLTVEIQRSNTTEKALRESEERFRAANEKLTVLVKRLEDRDRQNRVLGDMRELLLACSAVDEIPGVVASSVKQLFPGTSGALFFLNASGSDLEASVHWGDYPEDFDDNVFPPEACWALRRGRVHLVDDSEHGLLCPHLQHNAPSAYLCIPLVARGETLGLLHLRSGQADDGQAGEVISADWQEYASSLSEVLSLSIANVRLREHLSDQSVRDPLTKLFNRRYMEVTLTREIMRAERKNGHVTVIMMDVDHFKRFNDTEGHAAGDQLLVQLGKLLRAEFRGSDVACRYGGEEFAVFLLDCPLEIGIKRANKLRADAERMKILFHGKELESVTLSLGVAAYPMHGSSVEELLERSDEALYKAKSGGRNQVVAA